MEMLLRVEDIVLVYDKDKSCINCYVKDSYVAIFYLVSKC